MNSTEKLRLCALVAVAASWEAAAARPAEGQDPGALRLLVARARRKVREEFGVDLDTDEAKAAVEAARFEIERESVRDFLEGQKRAGRPICDAFEPCQAAKDEPEKYEPARTPCGRCGWTKDVHDHVKRVVRPKQPKQRDAAARPQSATAEQCIEQIRTEAAQAHDDPYERGMLRAVDIVREHFQAPSVAGENEPRRNSQ